ncbi:MAG: cobalt ECF transporter T component CbiQ [Firmicutes bacterium]|nr:cobalt ECF transporter T component CbiQ [Bacillota bacterium]
MSEISGQLTQLRQTDSLSSGNSAIHRLHPLAKLVVTIVYIVCTVSFGKYEFSGLVPMVLYPVLLFQITGIPFAAFIKKMRYVLPLVCAIGLFNPLFDKDPLIVLGGLVISGGTVSLITLVIKGILCLSASFLLIATTPFDDICRALRIVRVPSLLVSLMMLTYRYVAVLIGEASVMTDAYKLRAPGQKGIEFKAWGAFLGQLLLRSMDKAERIYGGMQLRGFDGSFSFAALRKARISDWLYAIILSAAFILLLRFDLSELIGSLFV